MELAITAACHPADAMQGMVPDCTCQADVDLVWRELREARGRGDKRVRGWDLILQQRKQCSASNEHARLYSSWCCKYINTEYRYRQNCSGSMESGNGTLNICAAKVVGIVSPVQHCLW